VLGHEVIQVGVEGLCTHERVNSSYLIALSKEMLPEELQE
jgi:hypothetical protein